MKRSAYRSVNANMRLLALLSLLVLACMSFAQDYGFAVRVRIRHADPWFVKAMMEGRPVFTPEISTILGFAGSGLFTGPAVNQLVQGGTFFVNPTDNSLWFVPDRR